MAETDLFTELKDVLADFKSFLDDKVPTIKPAIKAIAALIPQVNDLIDLLADLMNKIKTEIQNIDVSTITGLAEVTQFATKIKGFLDSAKKLLPDEAATIDQIAGVADVVTGLPSLDEVKGEIISLIEAIVDHLSSLKG